MSQITVITPDQVYQIVSDAVRDCMPAGAMPEDVAELERLKRKEYLTEGEVEKLFGLKASTLRKRRLNGEGPSYSKDGERVLYSRRKVEQYLESRRQKTHDQP